MSAKTRYAHSMKKLALVAFAVVGFISVSASADDKTVVLTTGPTHVMKEQIIIGRPAKPLAATEVSKLPMKSTLTELRQPLANRVEQPVASAPF